MGRMHGQARIRINHQHYQCKYIVKCEYIVNTVNATMQEHCQMRMHLLSVNSLSQISNVICGQLTVSEVLVANPAFPPDCTGLNPYQCVLGKFRES